MLFILFTYYKRFGSETTFFGILLSIRIYNGIFLAVAEIENNLTTFKMQFSIENSSTTGRNFYWSINEKSKIVSTKINKILALS